MPSLRLLLPAVPLVLVLGLAASLPSTSADAVVAPVLGSKAHSAPIGKGWGRPEPKRVDNGGDPSGKVAHLEWERWGTSRARGYGVTYLLKPGGGYYARPGRVVLRATGLGTCTDGTAAYTRLDVRVAQRPGEPASGQWRPGAATATSAPRGSTDQVGRRQTPPRRHAGVVAAAWKTSSLPARRTPRHRTTWTTLASTRVDQCFPRTRSTLGASRGRVRGVDLQELSDRAEITDVLVRYTRAVDTGEWDRLDTVFTADAEIDYTETGGIAAAYPETKAWLAEVLPAFFPKRLHTLGQVEIRLAGDEAEVTAYFHNPMPMDDGHGGTKVVEFGGLYHHTMRRTPDGWRSVRLREEMVWKRGL